MVAEMITKIGIPSDAELFLRVIVASILGYMIGYERKNRDKSAGMKDSCFASHFCQMRLLKFSRWISKE